MQTMTLSELAADLRTLSLSRGAAPSLPNGARPPAEILDQ